MSDVRGPPADPAEHARARRRLIAAFAAVYFIWGSSFVASKVMVTSLPVVLAAGSRFVVAGLVLGAVAWALGNALPRSRREWRHAFVMGLFTVVGSNGLNAISIQHIPSNQSALLNASSALWIAILGTQGRRHHPLNRAAVLGLVLGFAGVALVVWPRGTLLEAHFGWQLATVIACLSWALGTFYYREAQPTTPPLMHAAMQMLLGGLSLAAIGIALGQANLWQWSVPGAISFAYLTLFSSCVAYAAFAYLMTHTTPARYGTYAYVNPAVAAILGWLYFGERLSKVQLLGTAIILAGVGILTLAEPGERPAPPTESAG
jgi:drug/metabolite transporter (DMT)-like permease